MKKYLFGQFRYERRSLCDIYIVDRGEPSFVCTIPITIFINSANEIERLLETLTEMYGKIRVRPSRFDDIPHRFRKHFVAIDNDYLFASNPLFLEAENDENTEADAFAKCCE